MRGGELPPAAFPQFSTSTRRRSLSTKTKTEKKPKNSKRCSGSGSGSSGKKKVEKGAVAAAVGEIESATVGRTQPP